MITDTDNWVPTVAAPTRIFQNITAGVTGVKGMQVTNNTSWAIYVSLSAVPPSNADQADLVIPARSTVNFPIGVPQLAYRWSGLVSGNGDLVSSAFTSDPTTTQVFPGVNAQGFNSLTGYAGSNTDSIKVALADANGYPTSAVTQALTGFTNGLLVENPSPLPVSVKRPGGAAKDFVTIVPAWSSQVVNLGASSVVLSYVFTTSSSSPVGSLAGVRIWPLETVQPWSPPVLAFDFTRFPPRPEDQVKTGGTIGGMVVGSRQNFYSLAIGELFVVSRLELSTVLQAAAGGFAQHVYDIEVSAGLGGAGASTILATQSMTCVASGAVTTVMEPVKGPLILGGGAAGNILRLNPTNLSFIAGLAHYWTLEGWKVPNNLIL